MDPEGTSLSSSNDDVLVDLLRKIPYQTGERPCKLQEENVMGKKRNGRGVISNCGLWQIWIVLGLAGILVLMPTLGTGNTGAGKEEGVLRAKLENGLRVVIVRNALAPVVTTMVNYLVGSNEAPEGFPGMAHAQEHMMFRGSPGLSANQLADIIAAMGGMFDADTQQTVTQYFLTVPSEDLDLALQIEAIRMRGVLDTEKLWSQERGAIEQEVAQDFSNPEYLFYTKVLADLFKGTPYAHTPLGTVSSFDRTTGAMLKKFYDTWYAPNNAIVVIVGDVEPQKTLGQVKRFFEPIPARKLPPRPEIRLEPVKPETLHLKTDQSYGLVMISFRMPGYGSPDYPASKVLSDVLSNQRSNLFALVPEGKALYAGFSLSTLPQAGLGYAMAAFPKGADASALVEEVKKILAEDLRTGLAAELVEATKRKELTKAELQKNSVFRLAMAWSQALAIEGKQSPQEEVNAIQQVSVEDVNRVARKYLDLNRAVFAILTPEASGKPVTAASGVSGHPESFVPKETKSVKLPDWADKPLRRVSIPTSTMSPIVTTLPNGLKLIVQPESISNTVSVFGHVRNNPDLEVPKGQEGVDEVLGQLFNYGTTSLDRKAFQKALDDIGARESAGTDFSLEVLKDYLDRGVELLADNVLRLALPDQAFKTVQKQVAATVAGRLQSPGYLAKRALRAALFPKGDPILREATPATVQSLTLEDVKSYYRKVFRPDLTAIVVVGKVTPEKARAVIEKHFGSWKASGPKPETLLPPVPLNKPSATVVPNSSRIQDKVTLAQTLGLTRSNPDYYALELGNHVLGGGFYATRFYQDLREKTGLVYYVFSSFDVGRTRSFYVVNYGCDPPNVNKARDIVERNLKEMQTAPVPPEELQLAKALLLRQIPLQESSVEAIAKGLLHRATHDLPLDEPILAAHRYVKLTAEAVKAAFARWLHPGDLVEVTEGPE
jgi:zinc protease